MSISEQDFDPFAGGELSHTVPLTPEQEEIWLGIELGGVPANLAYNQPIAVRLRGALDVSLLQRSLEALVARHEALRTTLSGEGSTLCIAVSAPLPFVLDDPSTLEPRARDAALARAVLASVNEPFDLVRGPLVRSHLVRLGPEEHVLLLTLHHIVCDGWSLSVLVRDLGRFYSALLRSVDPGLAPAVPFSRVAAERRASASSPEARASLEYWLSRFRDVPASLELPLEHPRPVERTFAADRVDHRLPRELVRGLRTLATDQGASFAGVLLAAFQVFLHRLTGQRSIVIVMPVAGQSITGHRELVGHCVRALPIRADLDPREPFSEHLAFVKGSLLDALEHSEHGFGSLVRALRLPRDPSRIPLSAVMFNVDPDSGPVVFHGLESTVWTPPRTNENFELFVNAAVLGDDVVLETMFKTDLFDRQAIERRLAELTVLLEAIVRSPSTAVGKLEVLTAEDRTTLLSGCDATKIDVPTETVCGLFRANARATPDRVAVTSSGRTLGYGELDRASAALAADLASAGIGPGSHVGVCLSRSVDLLVALLGVLRSGAAYVPLDPEYPRERLEFIATDAKLSALVTEQAEAGKLPFFRGRVVLVEALGVRPDGADLDVSSPAEPAYTIYTSGSTGKPKGVVVLHRNVTNFLSTMAHAPGLSRDDVLVAITTPSFDISVLELFLPLTVGATVVIATRDEVTDGRRLADLLVESRATVMQATPSGWRVLLEAGWAGKPDLKALTGGEALGAELCRQLLPRTESLWNCYGPTETTVWSTLERVVGLPVSIGRPIGNTRTYVLDADLGLVPPGVTGELHIGGAGVARGYLGRPELTRERFLPDPHSTEPSARCYKTGDLARVLWDGRLEWLGRSDFQVKIRGHRIELGEIEARLAALPGVREAVVVAREDRPGDQRLVAYVRAESGALVDERDAQERLRTELPSYMVPQHVLVLEAFPLTPNGKVDRRALPLPLAAAEAYRAPRTAVQLRVAADLAELLGVDRVGLDDDFFGLGGHSLLALRFARLAQTRWDIHMPMGAVFSKRTVQGLSDFVEAALAAKESVAAPVSGPADVEREEFVL